MPEKNYKYVKNLWNDAEVSKLDPVGRLIYRSNRLGDDQRITNTGEDDLIFLAICSPRFVPDAYEPL